MYMRASKKNPYSRGVKLIVTGGHICLAIAFKGPNVILELYKYNYSFTVNRELSTLLPVRNKVPGWIQPKGLVFATCAL